VLPVLVDVPSDERTGVPDGYRRSDKQGGRDGRGHRGVDA
jgi:hypothetical protein